MPGLLPLRDDREEPVSSLPLDLALLGLFVVFVFVFVVVDLNRQTEI